MQIIFALLLDVIFGDPQNVPHPVSLIGRVISFYEKIMYSQEDAKRCGVTLCLSVLATVALAVWVILTAAGFFGEWARSAVSIYLLYAALAVKSLKDEAMPVARLLSGGDLEAARRQVGRIVGRDTGALDEAGVTRAAIETIAESYIDGIISVLFYMTLGSLIGQAVLFAWLFKAASTMDSMIGYDDERYHDFGWAAAKLDDALNFVPARIGAVIAVAGGAVAGLDWRRGWKVFLRDRLKHKSPNSAHGESVFAGLLGLRLAGGAFYGGQWEARPSIGDDTRTPVPEDIVKALEIMSYSVAICAVLIFIIERRIG